MSNWKRYVPWLLAGLLVIGAYVWLPDQKQEEPPLVVNEVESEESKETEAAPTSTKLVVYVTGAVKHVAVYEMPLGARVGDVLTLAELTKEADPEQLNLAEPLTDGRKIVVPKKGETIEAPVTGTESSGVNGIHVNSATKEELMTVPGIGPAKAEAILNYLKEHGPFKRFEDLGEVKGFGEKTLENMKDYLLVP